MGDMGDIFNAMRADRRERVEVRVAQQRPFIEQLKARAHSFSHLPGGFRFVFEGRDGYAEVFDYWPQRGKWYEHNRRRYWQGEQSLLRRLDELGVDIASHEALDAGLHRILSRRITT